MNMHRQLASFGLILLAAIAGAAKPVAAGQMLSDYTWQKRPLLLFAPFLQDTRLRQTKRSLQERRCEVKDRDMIIGVIVEQGRSRLDSKPISATDAAALQSRYDIKRDQFAALLVGKDGGEKYRLYEPPDLDSIFDLIDAMPMRQDEMALDPVDCGETTR